MSEIELKGDAVMVGGAWHLSGDILDNGWAYQNDSSIVVYMDDCWLTPDTARSMASALLHFADKAEAWREAE